MERYSNIVKPSYKTAILMMFLLASLIITQKFAMCDSEEHDLTSQNQYLNTDYSSAIEANLAHHSLAAANPTTSYEDIIDYNDIHKVYKLFNTTHTHSTYEFQEVEHNSNELKSLNSFSNNIIPQEITIQLHSILI